MKKILVLSILVSLLLPSIIFAQGVPGSGGANECCIIKHNIDPLPGDTSGPQKGEIIAPNSSASCNLADLTDENADFYASPNNWGAYCAIDAVYTITDWIFWVAFVIGGIIIVIGGIMFMTSRGSAEKATNAKNALVYGVVGIVVALVAKIVPAIARFFIGA